MTNILDNPQMNLWTWSIQLCWKKSKIKQRYFKPRRVRVVSELFYRPYVSEKFKVCSNYKERFLAKTKKYINQCLGWVVYGEATLLLTCCFSFNNSETVETVNLSFCDICNFSIETFKANLAPFTCPSFQILYKTQTGYSRISGQILYE